MDTTILLSPTQAEQKLCAYPDSNVGDSIAYPV